MNERIINIATGRRGISTTHGLRYHNGQVVIHTKNAECEEFYK
jgi:hypothetical protein